MPELVSGQYAIGDLLMGKGTPFRVTSFDPGSPDFTSGDVVLPGEDGMMPGRDTISGPVFTIEMVVNNDSAADARSNWRALQSQWRDPVLRSSPMAVTTWSSMYENGTPVRAYGRPRKLDLANGAMLRAGIVELQAEFQATDYKWYSEEEKTTSLSLMPTLGSGPVFPVTFPLTWGTYQESLADVALNEGSESTWPVITFTGPVGNPSLEFLSTGAKVTYTGTLAYDQSVTLDTRPWARSILNQSGGSVAGKVTGSRLAEFSLPPGPTVLAFRGSDNTGTSRCTVTFRDAYPTL